MQEFAGSSELGSSRSAASPMVFLLWRSPAVNGGGGRATKWPVGVRRGCATCPHVQQERFEGRAPAFQIRDSRSEFARPA